MADAGPVLAAAVAGRDHVAALLEKHDRTCGYCAAVPASASGWACRPRASLAAHLARAQARVDLLTPPETEAMFGE